MFLQEVLSEPILSNHIEVKHFLDPMNYSLDFYGELSSVVARAICTVWGGVGACAAVCEGRGRRECLAPSGVV